MFLTKYSAQDLEQIFKDKLAKAEDSYQHYTMVDKVAVLAFWSAEDIKIYKSILALIDELKRKEN